MKSKRGQFFILAAVILVSILASIFLYTNEVFLQESSGSIESLKKEISGETANVIDYGLYSGEDRLEEFIGNMSENLLVRSNPEMIFFYGNSTELKILNIGEEDIQININNIQNRCPGIKNDITPQLGLGDMELGIQLSLEDLNNRDLICNLSLGSSNNHLNFTINETEYSLPLNTNKNFYFIIKQVVGDQVYVATG
jgi:hypothetical protein